MQITIELVNDNALGLLQYLEKLNIIRLVKREKVEMPNSEEPRKSRFAGRISPTTATNLQEQLQQSREGWQH
jgi:hypothetical protein